MRKRRRIGLLLSAVFCLVSLLPGVALANGATETTVQEENVGALTPDGNLTLVDDYTVVEEENKQFLTFVTKSGNYFYMVVDRDADGKHTVHFLNQVDEADLLALMDEAAVESYEAEKETQEPVTEPETERVPVETLVDDVQEEPVSVGTIVAAIILVLILGGGGIWVVLQLARPNKTRKRMRVREDYDYEANDAEEDEDVWTEEDTDDF